MGQELVLAQVEQGLEQELALTEQVPEQEPEQGPEQKEVEVDHPACAHVWPSEGS